jgi:hypothetical protein
MKNIIDAVLAVITILIPRLKKPDSLHGVQETKEALVAINEIALFLAVRFKDGLGADDAVALYNKIVSDHDFKAKLFLAYDNYQKIPQEIKDIDAGEGLELVQVQVEYVNKFITAFNAPKQLELFEKV